MLAIAIEQPSREELDVIGALLRETYWATNIPQAVVDRAWRHSMCALARDEAGALIGFARLVTDKATFGWLCDVVVTPPHHGKGVARALVRAFRDHPELQGFRRWLLATKDAHGVYAPLGFGPLKTPTDRWMEIRLDAPYGVKTT